eukprot:757153-Prorocentrum_minimum.AAC.1
MRSILVNSTVSESRDASGLIDAPIGNITSVGCKFSVSHHRVAEVNPRPRELNLPLLQAFESLRQPFVPAAQNRSGGQHAPLAQTAGSSPSLAALRTRAARTIRRPRPQRRARVPAGQLIQGKIKNKNKNKNKK